MLFAALLALAAEPAVLNARDLRWLESPATARRLPAFAPTRTDLPQASAIIRCRFTGGGRLTDCVVVEETPADAGAGAYALRLARFFRAQPRMTDGSPVKGRLVDVPFRLSPPPRSAP